MIPITWHCHVCGDERPDQDISVLRRTVVTPSGFEMGENVRYCNDRIACVEGARTVSFINEPGFRAPAPIPPGKQKKGWRGLFR